MSFDKKWRDGIGDFQALGRELEGGGWRSPDTYGKEFDSPGDFPAVYIFTLADTYDFLSGFVAYVGMSTQLLARWSGHETLRELRETDEYVKRWFMKCEEDRLREVEAELIEKYDPPWNIQGRRRGMALA